MADAKWKDNNARNLDHTGTGQGCVGIHTNTATPLEPSAPPSYMQHTTCDVGSTPVKGLPAAATTTEGIISFGQYGVGIKDMCFPIGLATIKDKFIVVSDRYAGKILIFEPNGHLRFMFPVQNYKNEINNICITNEGHILVTVSRAKPELILQYGLDGQLMAKYGNIYNQESTYSCAVFSDGKIAVHSMDTKSIYILTSSGKMHKKFGQCSRNASPGHLAVNSQNQIVFVDNDSCFVKIFSEEGELVHKFGGKGSQTGKLLNPLGICLDKYDNIIVADADNDCIQQFGPLGGHPKLLCSTTASMACPDAKPVNVALLDDKTLVVLLRGTNFAQLQVHKYTSARSKRHKSEACTLQ